MGPLTGQWKRTPIWLQILGKPPLRRHLIWAHFEEWEYRSASQVGAMDRENQRLRGLSDAGSKDHGNG